MQLDDPAAQIGVLVATATDPAEIADECLRQFGAIVPHCGVALCAWDPFARAHRPVGSIDYPADVLDYLSDGFFRLDPAYAVMRRGEAGLRRWRDMPASYLDSYSVQSVFRPAGYREGLTAYLVTREGRYAGAFHVSTATTRDPDDEAYATIEWLRLVFASVCDVMRRPLWLAASLEPTAHAVVVSRAGNIVELPGRCAGPWLNGDSVLLRLVRPRLGREWRFLWDDDGGGWHRIHVLPSGDDSLIAETPTSLPHELTPRELDVLTLVAAGWSNQAIADALIVTQRTVATHVEHLLEKLDCSNRVACTALAVTEGLIRGSLVPEIDAATRVRS